MQFNYSICPFIESFFGSSSHEEVGANASTFVMDVWFFSSAIFLFSSMVMIWKVNV